jgi:hypothetical protein
VQVDFGATQQVAFAICTSNVFSYLLVLGAFFLDKFPTFFVFEYFAITILITSLSVGERDQPGLRLI